MITDFEVTYGEALAPAGFRRCTRPDKEKSANVNTGSGRAGQTYLWIHRGAQRGTPVVAVDVIYNDEPVPRGFERVARDMCKGSGRSSYLCFRRQRVAQAQQLQQDEEEDQGKEEEDERGQALAVDEQPLAEVVLAAGYEDPGPGFVRLDKPLSCKGESPLFLCYKRVLPVGPPDSQPWSPSALRVGDLVDLQDALGRWVMAQVKVVGDGVLSVQAQDAQGGFDQELPFHSPRLAAFGTHTGGDGGSGSPLGGGAGAGGEMQLRPQGTLWEPTPEELALAAERMDAIAAQLDAAAEGSPEEAVAWEACLRELPPLMEHGLSSAHASEAAACAVVTVALVPAYALLAAALRRSPQGEPLPPGLELSLSLALNQCWLFDNHGHGLSPAEAQALLERGPMLLAAPLHANNSINQPSAYFVFLLNRWAEFGGLDALCVRMGRCPLKEVTTYMAVLERLFPYYAPVEAGRRVMLGVIEHALGRVENLTNEELGQVLKNKQLGDAVDSVDRESVRLLSMWHQQRGARGGVGEDEADDGGVPAVHRVREEMQLRQAFRMLTCPYLNYRLNGLAKISELAEMAQRREQAQRGRGNSGWYSRGGNNAESSVTRWLTLEGLLRRVVELQVVEVVLGEPGALREHGLEDTHLELVRRAEGLLGLLADTNLLDAPHVDALWAAAGAAQASDTRVRAVYRLLQELAPKLRDRPDLLGRVHEHLQRGLPRPYEAQHVELVTKVAEAGLHLVLDEGAEKKDPLGLMLLWGAVLGHTDEEARPVPDSDDEDYLPAPPWDPHAPPEPVLKVEVREQAMEAIVALLLKRGSVVVLARFLRRLLRAVRDGRRVCPALLLIYKIMESRPEEKHLRVNYNDLRDVTRNDIPRYLNVRAEKARHGGLHLVVIEGLRAYREEARAVARSRGLLPAGDEAEDGRRQEPEDEDGAGTAEHAQRAGDAAVLDAVLVEGGCEEVFAYREEVHTRLAFLDYAAKESELKLAFGPHMEPLWTMFVGDPLCPGERDLFLNWLCDIIPTDEAPAAAAVRYHAPAAPKCAMGQAAAKELFRFCLAVAAAEQEDGGGSAAAMVLQGDGTATADAAGRAPRHPYRRAAELGAPGYRCLERYFRVINGWEGHLGQPLSPQGFVVRWHGGLEGMEALWDVYWHSPLAAVSQEAGAFLINLHLRVAARDEDRAAVWAALVHHCQQKIMAASAPSAVGDARHLQQQQLETRAVARALRLLRLFFEELQRPGPGKGQQGMGSSGVNDDEYAPSVDEVAVVVEVQRLDGGTSAGGYPPILKELRYYFKNRAVSLGQLRARVAADCGCRPLLVRLLSGSQQILHADRNDGVTIEQPTGYGAHTRWRRFYAVLLSQPEQDTAGVDPGVPPAVSLDEAQAEERREPLRALSADQAFMEQVFRLAARAPAQLVPEAWALLQMAPDIAWIKEGLRTLGGHFSPTEDGAAAGKCATWEALLHGREPIRFLYNLQCIDKLLAPSTDPYALPEERRAALRWELAFVRMGGMAYLLAVLAAWDLEAPSGAPALAKLSLSALIRRIAAFMPPRAKGRDNGVGARGGGAGRTAVNGSGRRGHMPTSSSSSLFLMGMADGGSGMEGEAAALGEEALGLDVPILGHVNIDEEEDGADAPGEGENEDENGRARRRVHKASARVFALVDRRALTERLVDVLHEVTKSAIEEEAAAGPAPLAGAQEDDTTLGGAASDDEQSLQPVAAGAIVARPVAGSTTPRGGRRNSIGGGGLLRGARELVRRQSWLNPNDWGSDLFKDEPARQPAPAKPSEDVSLVQASLGLLVMLGAGGPGLLDVVLNSRCLTELLQMGLLLAPDEALRRALARGVHRLCVEGRRRLERARRASVSAAAASEADDEEDDKDGSAAAAAAAPGQDPVRGFLTALLELLRPDGVVEQAGGDGGTEYFKLLTRLLKAPNALQELDPTAVARTLAGQIVRRRVFEATEAEEDRALQGLLTALRALLWRAALDLPGLSRQVKAAVGGSDVGLLRELFDRCLFAMPSAEVRVAGTGTAPSDAAAASPRSLPLPKCKHASSRNLALGLVLELAAECPENLREVMAVLEKHNPLGVSPEEKERRRVRALRKRRAQQQQQLQQQGGGWRRRSGSMGGSTGAPMLLGSNQGGSLLHGLSKSRTGYVGLKNLGCICYMNSTLQQLFMVKGFRAGLLACVPPEEEGTGGGGQEEEEEEEDNKEESLLFQLQSLFAHLQETDKAYYNPKGFCHAFKGLDGEPTDVFIQQDASDFLLCLFQQLEALTQGTPSEALIKEYFGFDVVNELIADGGRYSARAEPSYFLSLHVPDMGDLDHALEEFIKGEVLTDYGWERKDEETGEVVKDRVPTLKRHSLQTMPPHLIVHLKRFNFDFETMQQIKLNDRLEFPVELDLWPYTLEGRPRMDGETNEDREQRRAWRRKQGLEDEAAPALRREQCRYRLTGVVVHMGTSNSGHYYSYIRERGDAGRGWFEFNDTLVSEFDPADLELECFGGQETGGGYRGSWTRERIRNAFLLIYDRCDVDDNGGQQRQQQVTTRPRVPPAIMEEILRENVEFWRKTHILTPHYFQFMGELLAPVYDPSAQEQALQATDPGHSALLEAGLRLATRFMLGTLVEAKDWDGLEVWSRRLRGAFERSPAARAWFLALLAHDSAEVAPGAGSGGLLWDMLLEMEERRGRVAVVELVLAVAHASLGPPAPEEEEEDENEKERDGDEASPEPTEEEKALCLDLVKALLALRQRVQETKGGAARADMYLLLLGQLLQRMASARALVLEGLDGEGPCFLELLALADEVAACMRNEAGSEAPAAAASATAGDRSDATGDGVQRVEVCAVVGDLLTSLLRACVIPGVGGDGAADGDEGGNGNGEEPPRSEPLAPAHVMTAAEEEAVCCPAFAGRLVLLVSSPAAKERVRELFQHLVWNNWDRTHDFLEAIDHGIRGGASASSSSAHGENVVVMGDGLANFSGLVLRACFRSLMLLAAVQDGDSMQGRRVKVAMKCTMAALEAQSCYVGATLLGLDMLMRLARESAQVRAWFKQGANPRPLTPPLPPAGGAGADSGPPASTSKTPRSASNSSLSALVHRISGGAIGTSATAVAATPTNGGGSLSATSSPRAGSGGLNHQYQQAEDAANELVSRPEVRWAEEWLLTHSGAGHSGGGNSISISSSSNNSAAESFWGSSGKGASTAGGSSAAAGNGRGAMQELLRQRVLEHLRGLAHGAYDDGLEYDEDMDPRAIVGRRIQIRWNKMEWYTGTVSAYNMSTGRHNILYDDNDDREYNLLLKDFVFIKPGSGGVRDD